MGRKKKKGLTVAQKRKKAIRRSITLKRMLKNHKTVAFKKKNGNLLAIDPASISGYADSNGNYGTWNLSKMIGGGKKWDAFEKLVENYIDEHKIDKLMTETPVYSGQAGATIHHAKLVAIIEKVCYQKSVTYFGSDPASIKYFALGDRTGKGIGKKQHMVEAAKTLFGYKGDEDNEADAICILNYLKSQLL